MAQWARENLHYIQHQFIHSTWETKMESWNDVFKFWRCQRNIKLNLKSHHKCYKCPERQTFFTSIGILILRFSSLDGVRNVYICSMVFSLHEVQDTIWNEGKLFIHYNIQLYINWWIKKCNTKTSGKSYSFRPVFKLINFLLVLANQTVLNKYY